MKSIWIPRRAWWRPRAWWVLWKFNVYRWLWIRQMKKGRWDLPENVYPIKYGKRVK